MSNTKTAQANPSNRDILTEVRAFREAYNTTVPPLVKDVQHLMDWKRGLEIADNAVEAYKRKEAVEQDQQSKVRVRKTKAELMKDLIPLAVALTALIYAILQRGLK